MKVNQIYNDKIVRIFIEILTMPFSQAAWSIYSFSNKDQYFPLEVQCVSDAGTGLTDQKVAQNFQCVLPINAHLEKVALIIYFWLIFLFIITSMNILYSAYLYLPASQRINYVKNLLYDEVESDEKTNSCTSSDESVSIRCCCPNSDSSVRDLDELITDFSIEFLKADVLLALHFSECQVGSKTVSKLIKELYRCYLQALKCAFF